LARVTSVGVGDCASRLPENSAKTFDFWILQVPKLLDGVDVLIIDDAIRGWLGKAKSLVSSTHGSSMSHGCVCG
jgi:hypothetical protein